VNGTGLGLPGWERHEPPAMPPGWRRELPQVRSPIPWRWVISGLLVFGLLAVGSAILIFSECGWFRCPPRAEVAHLRGNPPRMEVQLFETSRGNLNFRYRTHGGDLSFDWRDFSVRTPEGSVEPCEGDDSAPIYEAGGDWTTFYAICLMDPSPGHHRR
jgi:hypothetical protein